MFVYIYIYSICADVYLYLNSIRNDIQSGLQEETCHRVFQCQDIHLSTDHASCGNAPATPRHLAVACNYFAQHIQIDPTMSNNVSPNPKKEKNHLAAASVEYDFSH